MAPRQKEFLGELSLLSAIRIVHNTSETVSTYHIIMTFLYKDVYLKH